MTHKVAAIAAAPAAVAAATTAAAAAAVVLVLVLAVVLVLQIHSLRLLPASISRRYHLAVARLAGCGGASVTRR